MMESNMSGSSRHETVCSLICLKVPEVPGPYEKPWRQIALSKSRTKKWSQYTVVNYAHGDSTHLKYNEFGLLAALHKTWHPAEHGLVHPRQIWTLHLRFGTACKKGLLWLSERFAISFYTCTYRFCIQIWWNFCNDN